MMKLQFDANQDYQLDAVKAVVDIFEGQPLQADDLTISIDSNNARQRLIQDVVVGNQLLINEQQIALNTRAVQQRNGLELSETKGGGATLPAALPVALAFGKLKDGMNFTVEMETATGKTYVYLRTIHELYKTYGFKKFIIVVPSLAIKEGALKNLEITKEHFASLYNNPKMDWYVWDPKKRGQSRAFATNDSLQILVITIDSFTRAQNIIHQQSDWGVPIEYIRATNPIVIVDEPQNMETEIRKKAIEMLNSLCTLRYSATHKYAYNMLYKLDPVKAYDLGLVKKIEVDSVLSEDAFNTAYIHVTKIERQGKSGLVAHIEVDRDDTRGLQRQVLRISPGDDLFALTNREIYRDYILDRIDFVEQSVEFSNGQIFYIGQKNEGLHEEIVKYQVQRTVENHFEKEARLKNQGIKVLSLFFIDKVANYREYIEGGFTKGKFAKWFEEAYNTIQAKPKFSGVLEFEAEKVHNGYFSQDKSGVWKDTKGESEADDNTYELIMKEKERLLDPKEPLRFIFSHSALREGWDNPNVFQICTINETTSEIKKRQEIGRGLRLPVNTEGLRVRDDSINVLTVIANESYEDFARKLQSEIEEETGVNFSGRIKDKKERRAVKLNKGFKLDVNFKELWDRIKHQTRYHVTFDSNKLIEEVAKILREVSINRPRISSVRARVEYGEDGLSTIVRDSSGTYAVNGENDILIPDVLGKIQSHTKLTRKTIFNILKTANKIPDILVNPQQVIDEARRAINIVMPSLMVDGIKYEKIEGGRWEMKRFENEELETYLDGLVEVKNQDKTLYDHVLVDSDVERSFAKELENREDVKFYFKLPSWFKIDTPLGGYNPDWAVVFEGDKRIYFVAETKGTDDFYDPCLSESERQKILCGRKHFEVFKNIVYKAPVKTVQKLLE
jgi:type III restriction enzyme